MKTDILRAGFFTSVQDLGRTGFRQFGVSSGGALDAHLLRVANLLVGNEESAAGLEVTLGDLKLGFADERIVAWGGGEFDVHVGSMVLPSGHAGLVRSGEELAIARPNTGCRAWIAISGGIDAPIVLGSRSTDLRANFGGIHGRVLRDGDVLSLGVNSQRTVFLIDRLRKEKIAPWKPPHDWSSPGRPEPVLHFVRGSEWDGFSASTHRAFTSEGFVVSPDSDRMGVRFDGPELKRDGSGDLLSEAVAPGTIQVPPRGKPILLLGDCQTIGGYPKIAHVITVDLSIAAQLRPGDQVSFREVSLGDAYRFLLERDRNLEQFRCGIESHFQ